MEKEQRVLITERLRLRPWTLSESDIGALYEYARNPNVGPHAGWTPHKSKEESREIIEKIFWAGICWAICLRGEDRPVGSIALEKDGRRMNVESREMGYSLSEEYWGNGYMTEAAFAVMKYAFEELCLDVVCICTSEENFRSQRIIEKCGFTFEGVTRNARLGLSGSPIDTMNFSMLKEEWKSRPNKL